MLGPETEDEAFKAVEEMFGSYHELADDNRGKPMIKGQAGEAGETHDEEEGFSPGVEGQELLLPTVRRYGLVKRYNSTLKKKVQKKKIENEDTLLGRKHSKPEMVKMKSDLEKFFRYNAVQVDSGILRASENVKMMSFIEEVVDQEFPVHEQNTPKDQELIHVGELESNKGIYVPGDWVEIEGNDMIWRLGMVTRAVRRAPDDWDWNNPKNEGKEPKWKFTYNAGLRRNIKEIDLRSPEAGLKLIFGSRPWVWQQWAILKVEEMLRFQPGHQNDFATKDIQKFAADLWDQWLNHPANLEFRELFYDDRIGEKGRTVLVEHIQKPFELIDRIGEENDDWDFSKDDNINVFTYLSLLGSGILIPTLVLLVQLAIPLLLIVDTLYDEGRCINGDQLTNVRTKIMAIIIFLYYMYTIVPDTYSNFFNIIGAADTVFSRLLSLRRKVWIQGDDTLLQMIGFKLDIYMNTSYQSLLMSELR